MEAENADLLDRRLMSLYGVHDTEPSKMDIHGTESRAVHNKIYKDKKLFKNNAESTEPSQSNRESRRRLKKAYRDDSSSESSGDNTKF